MQRQVKTLTNEDVERAAASMLRFWISPISKRGWDERLALLEKIDEEIREIPVSRDIHERMSSVFTAMLIEKLTDVRVHCLSQAYLYLNSANPTHRQAAIAWLILHNSGVGLMPEGTATVSTDKRCAIRHEVDLPSVLSANDNLFEGKLVDISSGGARVAVSAALEQGSRVELAVPMLGNVAATVVWASAAFIGLAFVPPAGAAAM